MSVPTITQPIDADNVAGSSERQESGPAQDQTSEGHRSPVEGGSYIAATKESLLPPPDFKPFFTLVEDADTGDVHHPTVHYVFSDDDPDVLTAAALAGLEGEEDVTSRDIEDRFLLVDVGPDGKSVENVASFSPDWQATHTEVSKAPSWSVQGKSTEALKLKIIGKEASSPKRKAHKRKKGFGLEDIMKEFEEQLDALEELVERGEAGIRTDEECGE